VNVRVTMRGRRYLPVGTVDTAVMITGNEGKFFCSIQLPEDDHSADRRKEVMREILTVGGFAVNLVSTFQTCSDQCPAENLHSSS
jgi:hypothetical protein